MGFGLIRALIIVAVVAIAIVFGALNWLTSLPAPDLQALGESITDFVSSPTRFFVGAAPEEERIDFDVNLTKVGAVVALDFKEPLGRLALNYEDETAVLRVAQMRLTSDKEIDVGADDFKGKVSVTNKVLELAGTSPLLEINSQEFSDGEIKISTINMSFESLELKDVPKVSFELSNVTGELTWDEGKGSYNLKNEKLGLRNFEGDMTFEGTTVRISGKAAIKTPRLVAPGESGG